MNLVTLERINGMTKITIMREHMIWPTIYIANTSMLRLVIVPAVYAVMTNVPYGITV